MKRFIWSMRHAGGKNAAPDAASAGAIFRRERHDTD
jgi:hypothetical protein